MARIARLLAGLAVLAALTAGTATATAGTAAAAPRTPRCFGAASRDPAHRCVNLALRLVVRPTPRQAAHAPYAPCVPRPEGALFVCAFPQLPPPPPKGTFALIGDSHASHWRAALQEVVRRRGYHAVSVTKSSCPLSFAVPALAPAVRVSCTRWRARVLGWLGRHPEVSTLFVSAHVGAHYVVAPGETEAATVRDGYLRLWDALPRSVRSVIVLRDVPRTTDHALRCVERAIRRRVPAGPACAIPRRFALPTDPQVGAALHVRGTRVHVVDLTELMCYVRLCPPVVGGALVHKDPGHMTVPFSRTLGPYVLRAAGGLLRAPLPGSPGAAPQPSGRGG